METGDLERTIAPRSHYQLSIIPVEYYNRRGHPPRDDLQACPVPETRGNVLEVHAAIDQANTANVLSSSMLVSAAPGAASGSAHADVIWLGDGHLRHLSSHTPPSKIARCIIIGTSGFGYMLISFKRLETKGSR